MQVGWGASRVAWWILSRRETLFLSRLVSLGQNQEDGWGWLWVGWGALSGCGFSLSLVESIRIKMQYSQFINWHGVHVDFMRNSCYKGPSSKEVIASSSKDTIKKWGREYKITYCNVIIRGRDHVNNVEKKLPSRSHKYGPKTSRRDTFFPKLHLHSWLPNCKSNNYVLKIIVAWHSKHGYCSTKLLWAS